VERWTARLQSLLADRAGLEDLRARVARFAREQWAWDRCVARYAELLEACARR
jgi:hypothetical protein